jgi:hypothetical protein
MGDFESAKSKSVGNLTGKGEGNSESKTEKSTAPLLKLFQGTNRESENLFK